MRGRGVESVFTHFFYLGTLRYDCMTIELLAVYVLLANVLFLFGNIKKFDWKNKRLKEETAFLPGVIRQIKCCLIPQIKNDFLRYAEAL